MAALKESGLAGALLFLAAQVLGAGHAFWAGEAISSNRFQMLLNGFQTTAQAFEIGPRGNVQGVPQCADRLVPALARSTFDMRLRLANGLPNAIACKNQPVDRLATNRRELSPYSVTERFDDRHGDNVTRRVSTVKSRIS